MTRPIRVGVVGGNAERGWARDAHVPALARLPQFALAAVSARSQEAAEAAARAFGAARAYGDTFGMIADPEVDLIVVTVKVPEHRSVVLAALEAGKHVFCEWPLGRDVGEAEEMAAAVRPETHAVIGLQGLFAPAVRQAADLIGSGKIGRPRVLRAFSTSAAWGAETPAFNAYLQDKRSGATLETIGGGHTLATLEALVGAYVEVDARNTTLRPEVRVQGTGDTVRRTCADHMLVLGRHESGCVSTLEVVGGTSPRPILFEVEGETGWLRIVGARPGAYQLTPLMLEASVDVGPPPQPVAPELSGPPANVAEIYALLAADIAAGARRAPDFPRAVRLSRLLAAIDAASESGLRQALAPPG